MTTTNTNNNNTEGTTMKTLTDKEQIRTTIDQYEPVTVMCITTNDTTSADTFDHRGRDRALGYNHTICTTIRSGAMLTDNYPGKAEEMQRKADAYAAATLVEDGEHIIADGCEYVAKYIRRDVSDPVHFIPVKPECTEAEREQYAKENASEFQSYEQMVWSNRPVDAEMRQA